MKGISEKGRIYDTKKAENIRKTTDLILAVTQPKYGTEKSKSLRQQYNKKTKASQLLGRSTVYFPRACKTRKVEKRREVII